MRKFNVTVNGISYEVNVEEVGEETSQTQPTKTVKQEQKQQKKATPVDGVKITAPMPGNVWKILKKDGDTVKKGEVILVLEAMKMENDIVSSADGTLSLSVEEGSSVSSGDILAVIA